MKLILEETNLIDFNDGSELAPELEKIKEETIKETNKELEARAKVVSEVNGKEHHSLTEGFCDGKSTLADIPDNCIKRGSEFIIEFIHPMLAYAGAAAFSPFQSRAYWFKCSYFYNFMEEEDIDCRTTEDHNFNYIEKSIKMYNHKGGAAAMWFESLDIGGGPALRMHIPVSLDSLATAAEFLERIRDLRKTTNQDYFDRQEAFCFQTPDDVTMEPIYGYAFIDEILEFINDIRKYHNISEGFKTLVKESLETSEEEITTESVISGLVKSVWDSVTNYKASLISLNSLEGAAEVIEDIIGDLYVHIGQLQGLTTEFVNSEAVEAIEQGKEETAEILNQPTEVEVEIEDDDIPEEVVEKLVLKRK